MNKNYPVKMNTITGNLVYFLRNDRGEIIYVGKTTNFNLRVNAHLALQYGEDIDTAEIIFCETPNDATILELYYIAKYQPTLNTVGKQSISLIIENESQFERIIVKVGRNDNLLPPKRKDGRVKGRNLREQLRYIGL